MALSDTLAKLAGMLPEGSGEVNALLAAAKREAQSLHDDLHSVNAESASRKNKIRELQAELDARSNFAEIEQGYKAEIDALKKVKAEFDAVKQAEDAKAIAAWRDKAAVFATDESDKRHAILQKIRDDFHWAGEGKELSAAEARDNLERFGLIEKAGALSVPDTHTPNVAPPSPNTPTPQYQNSGQALWAQMQTKK